MAQKLLDPTGQERSDYAITKINENFTDLYASVGTGDASVTSLKVDSGTKTATAVAGAATLNKSSGKITSEAITTAAGADYTLTLTNSQIAAADLVFASVALTAAGGEPMITSVTPAAGSVVIVVHNVHASAAFAGAIKISFAVFKA